MTLKQKAFVKALTDPNSPTYCKPSASYRKIAPGIAPGADAVGAHRMLRNDNVSAIVDGQLSLEDLEHELTLCLTELKKERNWDSARATVMDYAKLTGKIVDRSEVKTITDADSSAVRDLVKASMTRNSDAGMVRSTVNQ